MEFLLIASTHFLALLSPGPDFFLLLQASIKLPKRYAISICGGISVANAVYLTAAVIGLEVVRESMWLVTLLKYLGAAYMIFLGIVLLRTKVDNCLEKDTGTILHENHLGKQFVLGFMSGILNPKNAIFYLALFTVMVSEQTPLAMRCLYALWMILVVFLWDCGVVMVIGHDLVKNWLGRGVYMVEKVAGLMLALFGIVMPFS